MNAFLPANILLPKTDHMEKWAVIACDQFTSDQAYWDRVRKNAEGAVSTINLILPEASAKVPRWLELVEQVSRAAYLLAMTLLVSREPASARCVWLWLAAALLALRGRRSPGSASRYR